MMIALRRAWKCGLGGEHEGVIMGCLNFDLRIYSGAVEIRWVLNEGETVGECF